MYDSFQFQCNAYAITTHMHECAHTHAHTKQNKSKTFRCLASMVMPTQWTTTGTPVWCYGTVQANPPGIELVIRRRCGHPKSHLDLFTHYVRYRQLAYASPVDTRSPPPHTHTCTQTLLLSTANNNSIVSAHLSVNM